MYFNVHAFLEKDYKTIFRGTMVYLPRIGEEIVFGSRTYTVTNVRHIIYENRNLDPDIQLFLK